MAHTRSHHPRGHRDWHPDRRTDSGWGGLDDYRTTASLRTLRVQRVQDHVVQRTAEAHAAGRVPDFLFLPGFDYPV